MGVTKFLNKISSPVHKTDRIGTKKYSYTACKNISQRKIAHFEILVVQLSLLFE